MPASPSSVLTRGLGSWGSSSLLLTRGLGIGAVVVPPSTSRPFYRPQGKDLADVRLGSPAAIADVLFSGTEVADTRRLSIDEQVQ